jgi:hypothetical protein
VAQSWSAQPHVFGCSPNVLILEPHFPLSNVEKTTALRLNDVRQYSSVTTASIPSQPTIISVDFWQNLLEMSANEGLLSNKAKQPDKDITGKPWITGGVKRFPVLGVCALLGNILCKWHHEVLHFSDTNYLLFSGTVFAIIVLRSSNGKDIDKWGYGFQPSSYLSILNVAATLLLATALAQGVKISFWRKALRGTTVSQIEHKHSQFTEYLTCI